MKISRKKAPVALVAFCLILLSAAFLFAWDRYHSLDRLVKHDIIANGALAHAVTQYQEEHQNKSTDPIALCTKCQASVSYYDSTTIWTFVLIVNSQGYIKYVGAKTEHRKDTDSWRTTLREA